MALEFQLQHFQFPIVIFDYFWILIQNSMWNDAAAAAAAASPPQHYEEEEEECDE